MAFSLSSPAFRADEKIPRRFSGEGDDLSPKLEWNRPPAGTKELALICDDPDAPTRKPFVHWVVYNIPGDVRALPENLPKTPSTDRGIHQGRNSFAHLGYNGPLPPSGHGLHHYRFKLYALDEPLDLDAGATKEELEAVMANHVLEQTQLIGLYERP